MECIPYLEDLRLEVETLKLVRTENNKDEIDYKIEEKENLIKKCKENLDNLSSNQIYYRLYLYMLDGLTPSKAIEKVASENYSNDIKPNSFNGVWNYYKKMKKILK